ncbi:MAG: O-antigen ligase family protein [Candidatus Doudnabacteria bacterium]|nr:O-antigen ligase family protein [Candidatus Doudnabacteria bacterium]
MPYLLGLTLLLSPTYAIRFNILGLPANALMVWLFLLWAIFVVWIFYTNQINSFGNWLRSELSTKHFVLSTTFLLAGITSLFVGGFSQQKLGQFIVLFLQPMGTFIVARYVYKRHPSRLGSPSEAEATSDKHKDLLRVACYLLLALSGLYAIIQYFTLLGVPEAWWGNANEPKRALAFFLHPNFYALFITPLLAFLLPQVVQTRDQRQEMSSSPFSNLYSLTSLRLAWLLGATGLLLSLSRGGWLGLVAAVGAYVLLAGNRKIVRSAAAVGALVVLIVIVVPNFRYRVLLPFQGEKSSVARFSLWKTGWHMVEDSPILGKGLLGFSNNWGKYNTDPGLEHYPAPHNIFLNFWVDTGLLGLISFFGLILLALKRGWQNRRNQLALGLTLACVALVVHGLVDIPYSKNDLALLFWVLYSYI